MNENAEPTLAGMDEARNRPLADDLRALASDAVAFAAAEAELQKARAAYAAGSLKSIVLLGALAAVLVLFALVALTVGLVIALTPIIGALGATFAVFGGLLAVALICAWLASGRWKRMVAALSNPKGA
jgi:uncharacterized membrane protein YqjE